MIFAFLLPDNDKELKGLPITEKELFQRDRELLKSFSCPHCTEKGGLYREFVSIGCYECFWHNGVDEVVAAN